MWRITTNNMVRRQQMGWTHTQSTHAAVPALPSDRVVFLFYGFVLGGDPSSISFDIDGTAMWCFCCYLTYHAAIDNSQGFLILSTVCVSLSLLWWFAVASVTSAQQLQERNHVCFLVVMGMAFTAIPIHQHYTLNVW